MLLDKWGRPWFSGESSPLEKKHPHINKRGLSKLDATWTPWRNFLHPQRIFKSHISLSLQLQVRFFLPFPSLLPFVSPCCIFLHFRGFSIICFHFRLCPIESPVSCHSFPISASFSPQAPCTLILGYIPSGSSHVISLHFYVHFACHVPRFHRLSGSKFFCCARERSSSSAYLFDAEPPCASSRVKPGNTSRLNQTLLSNSCRKLFRRRPIQFQRGPPPREHLSPI